MLRSGSEPHFLSIAAENVAQAAWIHRQSLSQSSLRDDDSPPNNATHFIEMQVTLELLEVVSECAILRCLSILSES
jgi:hypothetical protein